VLSDDLFVGCGYSHLTGVAYGGSCKLHLCWRGDVAPTAVACRWVAGHWRWLIPFRSGRRICCSKFRGRIWLEAECRGECVRWLPRSDALYPTQLRFADVRSLCVSAKCARLRRRPTVHRLKSVPLVVRLLHAVLHDYVGVGGVSGAAGGGALHADGDG
jgi:hypothetical protein